MVKPILWNLGLAALAALLFAGAFPNPLIENGVPALAWVAYVPVFLLAYRVSVGASIFWGALYALLAYSLFNYWLAAFHPLAGTIVYSVYMVYLALVFVLLRLSVIFFPRRAYIAHWLIWLGYEYLRTLGFLGYAFGVTGYSQWRVLPIIQIADVFGVWGVSALVVFPSAWLAAALARRGREAAPLDAGGAAAILPALRDAWRRVREFWARERIAAAGWLCALVAALVYGFAVPRDFSDAPRANIALIQHNTDPWIGGTPAFRRNFEILSRLSDEALAAYPRPDMVVWSETAFTSRIVYHLAFRYEEEALELVEDLLRYMARQDVPFVIGNHDARVDPVRNPNPLEGHIVNFNAALLFEEGRITEVYRKKHLVPFTEHFPFRRQFPRIHRWLREADTHFWDYGTEPTVFRGPGFYFSTPICFEESYGYLGRLFVREGAEVLVNLSNMAWASSLSSQNQQLKMAVFRAVENRRAVARSTASGQTAAIYPDGRISAMAPPFEETWITVSVPVVRDRVTLYTRFGDFLGVAFALAAGVSLIIGSVSCIIKKTSRGPAPAGRGSAQPSRGAGRNAPNAVGKPRRRKR